VLRLLHNMSFDAALRQQMMAAGLVQQVGFHATVPLGGPELHISAHDRVTAAVVIDIVCVLCYGGLRSLLHNMTSSRNSND
jgi:hypothetical protein